MCFLFLSSVVTWTNEEIWPKTISKKHKKFLYKKIKHSLKQVRKNKSTININLLTDKKLYRGKVTKVGKTKFTIITYKKEKHTLKFKKMRAISISKLLPSKMQKGKILHLLGLIALHEGKKDIAQKYFQRADDDNYKKAGQYLTKLKEEAEQAREQKDALARKEREDAILEKEKREQEEARSKIPNIASLGSEKLNVQSQSFPGKYTIFKFGAPW